MSTQYTTPASWPTTAKARARCLALEWEGTTTGSQWSAKCPTHNDTHASLRIRASRDGRKVLMHCHSGCRNQDILRTWPLPLAYLTVQDVTSPTDFRTMSLQNLMDKPIPTVRWTIEDILLVGGLGLLGGQPKSGKSTLMRQLTTAMVRGTSFVGHQTHQGGVLYFPLEEIDTEVARHFRTLKVDGTEPIMLVFTLQGTQRITPLARAIALHRPALVIIDPLFQFLRFENSSDYANATKVFTPLRDLARQTHTAILCTHHLNKNETLLGSTALHGIVDIVMELKHTPHGRMLHINNGRGRSTTEETMLLFDFVTQTMQCGVSKQVKDIHWMGQQILTVLHDHGNLSDADLTIHVGGDRNLRYRVLHKLLEDERITRYGTGKKGNPYTYTAIDDGSIAESIILYNTPKNGMHGFAT